MPVPINYPEQETAIKTFNFTDVITGKAYQTLYAGRFLSGSSGFLRSFVFDSGKYSGSNTVTGWHIMHGGTSVGTTDWTEKADVDFDIETGQNLTVDGETIINGTVGIFTSTDPSDYQEKIIASIKKSGVHLVSGSIILSGSNFGYPKYREWRWGINLDVPKTTFKAGDTIRLNITAQNKITDPSTEFRIGCSPSNQTKANIITNDSTLKVFLPFKVDI